MQNERNEVLDICRGGAIFLVLLGHVIQYGHFLCDFDFWDNVLFRIIYSFHMPLFMLISGYSFSYSFKKRTLQKLIIHRVFPLIHSIFVFSILTLLLSGHINIFNGEWIINDGFNIWFLWSIIAASIPVAVIFKSIDNKILRIFLLFCSAFSCMLFPNFQINLYVYPYFVIGFIFSLHEEKLQEVKKILWIFIPLFILMFSFYQKKHFIYISGLYTDQYTLWEYVNIDLFRWIIGLTGSIAFIAVILIMKKKHTVIRLFSYFFSELGVYSLQIYLIQRIVVEFWYPKILGKICLLGNCKNFFVNKATIFYDFYSLGMTLLFSVGLLTVSKILTKNYGKILFGK